MKHLSDTPPDGDFARYVEQLNAKSAAVALARDAVAVSSGGRLHAPAATAPAPAPAPAPAHARSPMRQAAKNVSGEKPEPVQERGMSLWTVAKWAFVPWVALQLLSARVPHLGWLIVPIWLALAIWLVRRFKRASRGRLAGQLQQLAERATHEFRQRK